MSSPTRKRKGAHRRLTQKQRMPLKSFVIHISGASGSGKTTLGNKLKEQFGNQIIVKDIDDLRQEFIQKHYGEKKWSTIDKDAYQQFLDAYVRKQTKPLVLVGLNNMPWWHKDLYYNLHASYSFYIDIDNDVILRQKCLRLFAAIPGDKMAMTELIANNKRFLHLVKDAVTRECDREVLLKMNKKWEADYKAQGYRLLSRKKIYAQVVRILNKHLNA